MSNTKSREVFGRGVSAGLFAVFCTSGLMGVGLAGCGGKKTPAAPAGGDTSASVPKVDPTLCEVAGKNVVTYDLNQDKRPDVWRLYKNEEEGGTKVEYMTCKQVDFDHDGTMDWVVAFNRKGTRLYEKADMDYDKKFDFSAVFDPKSGKVAEVERDRNFDGKYDLKEIYDTSGQLQSVRHDTDGNGEPDQWEQYKDGVLIAILYDDNADGKVDRREEIPGARPKIEMPDTGVGPADGDGEKSDTDTDTPPAAGASATQPSKPGGSKATTKPAR